MKKTVFIVLAIALGFTACEDDDLQNSDIPSLVQNGFTEQFPDAAGVEWEKKADLFEAEFHVDSIEYEAILNPEGTVLKYKYEIGYDELPEAVQATISADFDETRVDDIELLQIGENSYYQVEFDEEQGENRIIFEESGQVNNEIEVW